LLPINFSIREKHATGDLSWYNNTKKIRIPGYKQHRKKLLQGFHSFYTPKYPVPDTGKTTDFYHALPVF